VINLEPYELQILLQEATKQGAIATLSELGLIKDEISQSEAFRIYGRYVIERLVESGSVKRKGGKGGNSKCTYKRSEIEMALTAKRFCNGWGERGVKDAIINSRKTNYKVLA